MKTIFMILTSSILLFSCRHMTKEISSLKNQSGAIQEQLIFEESISPINFKLTAPLIFMFEKAYAGLPSGIFPPTREKEYEKDASIQYNNKDFENFKIKVRGNNSLIECSFAKLKINFKNPSATQNSNKYLNKIRIGTHCGDQDKPHLKRMTHENYTWRQATVLDIARIVGLRVPRVKRAIIEYVDNSNEVKQKNYSQIRVNKVNVKRHAFLMEDTSDIAKEIGFEKIDDILANENRAKLAKLIKLEDFVKIIIFNSMVMNWDMSLPNPYDDNIGSFWNIDLIGKKINDEYVEIMPIVDDFDLAFSVTGKTNDQSQDIFPYDLEKFVDSFKNSLDPRIKNENERFIVYKTLKEYESNGDKVTEFLKQEGLFVKGDNRGKEILGTYISRFFSDYLPKVIEHYQLN